MTVCIAAMFGDGKKTLGVVGATDRLRMTENDEFESGTSKILALTNSLVVMAAGHSSVSDLVMAQVRVELGDKLKPNVELNTIALADVLSKSVLRHNIEYAERTVLSPLGLSRQIFQPGQQQLHASDYLSKLTDTFWNLELPTYVGLLTGVDRTGAHLLTVDQNGPHCFDSVGFNAVGEGGHHACADFMRHGQTNITPLNETLFNTYSAKKCAEISQNVGKLHTDMFIVGPGLNSFRVIPQEAIQKLSDLHDAAVREERKRGYEISENVVKEFKIGG